MTEDRQSPSTRLSDPRTLPIIVCYIIITLSGCSPTIKVQAPDKPIVINLNIKIEQEVRIKVEKGVEDLLSDNPDIF